MYEKFELDSFEIIAFVVEISNKCLKKIDFAWIYTKIKNDVAGSH